MNDKGTKKYKFHKCKLVVFYIRLIHLNINIHFEKWMKLSYCKTLAATTTSTRVWIAEVKSLSIKTVRKIQGSVAQIQKAFKVSHNSHIIILKYLIFWLCFVVKIQLI